MSAFDYRVLAYVAGLELALDRARGQLHLLGYEAGQFVQRVTEYVEADVVNGETARRQLGGEARAFADVLQDLQEPVREEAVSDVAASIPVRPLVEKIFRRLQRLRRAQEVELFVELEQPEIIWFPLRLQHIIESLIDNAFKGLDRSKGAARIQIRLLATSKAYELHVTDNGHGLSRAAQARLFDLFDRSAPSRLADPVVGMAVLKLLIEQSGGALTIASDAGVGASFVAVLPRFPESDFLA